MIAAIDVVKAFYVAASAGDVSAMISLLGENVRWTEMRGAPYGGLYVGPEAIIQNVFSRLGSEWEKFAFEFDRLYDAGDAIIAPGRYTGIFSRTGKQLDCRVLHLWKVRLGKITEFEQFCDSLLMSLVQI